MYLTERYASNLYYGVIECAEFKYYREIQFNLIFNANNYT